MGIRPVNPLRNTRRQEVCCAQGDELSARADYRVSMARKMMVLSDARDADRFTQIEHPLVKAAANDDSPDGQRAQQTNVIDISHPAAGDHWDVSRLCQQSRVNEVG